MGLKDKLNEKLKSASGRDEHEDPTDEAPPLQVPEVEEIIPGLAPRASSEDILAILQIPATFEIPSDTFLPEDLKEIEFDHQVPYGYDLGQVTRFVGQTRDSIHFYVKLLRQRNEHVAKLASVIDRQQVDANNMRFEREIAGAISIMPTSGEGELEEQLTEAVLENRRLQDRLRQADARIADLSTGTRVDQAGYENLMDELSVARLRVNELEEENQGLRTRMAYMEEEEGLAPAPVIGATGKQPSEALQNPMRDDDDEGLPQVLPRQETALPAAPLASSNGLPDPTPLFPRQVHTAPKTEGPYPVSGESTIQGGDMVFGEKDMNPSKAPRKAAFSLDDDDDDLEFIMGNTDQPN